MADRECQRCPELHDSFSRVEKLLLPTPWYIFVFIGFFAIFRESIVWGIVYFLFCNLAYFFGILYTLCAHCPYPYKFSDCLFFPHELIKRLYKHRPTPLTTLDRIGLSVSLFGMVLFPQYWLLNDYTLLILFWVFCIPAWASLPLYLCRRCRNGACPINLATGAPGLEQ